jgi:hypothetical protein
MTSGCTTLTDSSFTEPWRERTDQSVLKAKEKRVRERVAELYASAERAGDNRPLRKNLVRRCIVEAEGLLDLAAAELRKDWLGS